MRARALRALVAICECVLQTQMADSIVSLADRHLTELDDESWLRGCKELNLGGNCLTTLPEWIGELTSLERLNLGTNLELTALPESLGQLTRLEWLNLRMNRALTKLPESFGQLGALRCVHLEDCRLTELPESVGQLRSLQFLYLQYNQLTALPESLGALMGSGLTVLDLTGNRLSALPESFRLASSSSSPLQVLNLDGNRFAPEALRPEWFERIPVCTARNQRQMNE